MAARASTEEAHVSSSSFLAPIGRSSRPNSVSSLSSLSPERKEAFTQALDKIHSTASRSAALTTFNDFAPPPSPLFEDRGRSMQNAQGGFGGIYTRLKASVSSSASQLSPSPPRPQPNDNMPRPSSRGKRPPPLTKLGRLAGSPNASFLAPKVVSPRLKDGSSAILAETFTGASPEVAISDEPRTSIAIGSTKEGESGKEPFPTLSPTLERHSEIKGGQEVVYDRPNSSTLTSKVPSFPMPSKPLNVDDERRDSSALSKSAQVAEISRKKIPQLDLKGETPLAKTNINTNKSGSDEDDLTMMTSLSRKPQTLSKLDTGRGQEFIGVPTFQPSRTAASDTSGSFFRATAPSPSLSHVSTANNSTTNLRKPALYNVGGEGVIAQMRRKILSRDFWMKDENAKVCFNCGDSFSTFRRKHHCRLCGQIYCSNCTHLASGKPFGQASKLRVCKTCEMMMNGDDSSDFTEDDEAVAGHPVKQIRFSTPPTAVEMSRDRGSSDGLATPDAKKSRDLKRKSVPPSISDRQPVLARPPSSRSLKSLSGRPRSSSQKQRRVRNQHMRTLGLSYDTGAPFHQMLPHEGSVVETSLPVFHMDSVIDPDLAPFMSDEGSSEDETPSLAAALTTDIPDQPTSSFQAGFFGALRRGRPQSIGRLTIENPLPRRDSDSVSVTSSRAEQKRRQLGPRTVSVASFGHHRLVPPFPRVRISRLTQRSAMPRIARSDNLFASSDNLLALESHPKFHGQVPEYYGGQFTSFEMYIRRDADKPGSDFDNVSLEYVKRLLEQFLHDADIKNYRQWGKALVPILIRCAEYVDPNIHRGDDIDIRHYVKLKKAAGGQPSDSSYVAGVVFTKKLALKDMPRSVKNPRILLISFPLVYARHQQHFMSLEPIIAQEKEYLRNLVNRIKALTPSVLLVQKEVAGIALQYLQEAGIAVVYGVKPSVLQAVSRCTQTRIVSSAEKLTMNLNSLGRCESFDVKTYVHNNAKKSFIFFSGCQRDLGCTIVLRGGDRKLLHKLKWITEFMCYATYNLKLEMSLMRDEFISTPTLAELHTSPDYSDVPGRSSACYASAINNNEKSSILQSKELPRDENAIHDERTKLVAMTDIQSANKSAVTENTTVHFDTLVKGYVKRLLSVSPYVKLEEPYLVLRGRVQDQTRKQLRSLLDQEKPNGSDEDTTSQKFELVKPDVLYQALKNHSPKAQEVMNAIHYCEYEKACHTYSSLKRRWETYISGVHEPFSPLTHQRILVLFSIVSTPTLDACEGPDLLGLDFYQEHEMDEGLEPDVPLGEYVERLCSQAELSCTARRCDKKMLDHHRQYIHADGQISVYVQKYQSRLPGMENTILMWSVCRMCKHETQVTPMSSNSWKYSFGKYLELSFWSMKLHPRADHCPHDVHRDHKRFFGFKNLAISVQYDPIRVVEVTVPRSTITWAPERDLRLKNEEYQRMEDRLARFMSSVKMRIKSINIDSIASEKLEACRAEIANLTERANEEHDLLLDKLQDKYMNSKFYEITPLNRAMRYVQEKVAEWDTTFADFERDFFPSEKDIRRLATAQLRKVLLEREESTSSGDSEEKSLSRQMDATATDGTLNEKQQAGESGSSTATTDMDNTTQPPGDAEEAAFSPTILQEHEKQLVQNLDLAISMSAADAANHALNPTMASDISAIEAEPDPESFRHLKMVVSKPSPLQPELAAKVEQMVEASTQEQIDNDEEPSALPSSIRKRGNTLRAPPLFRAQSQPVGIVKETDEADTNMDSLSPQTQSPSLQISVLKPFTAVPTIGLGKFAERSAIAISRGAKSIVPRAVVLPRVDSKVSALAKHFEEMSREFEKERLRERRLRAQRNRQSRVYPMVASKPIVELFRDANEAARERDSSYEELKEPFDDQKESILYDQARESFDGEGVPRDDADEQPVLDRRPSTPEIHTGGTLDLTSHAEANDEVQGTSSYPPSEHDGLASDVEGPSLIDNKDLEESSERQTPSVLETPSESISDIPKHEKSSLMKMLTRFWSERSASGWSPLDYPLIPTDHIFADADIIVREDEPTSLIAFALASQDYTAKIARIRERAKADRERHSVAGELSESADAEVEQILLGKTSTHMKYQFQAGPARMLCKVFYAESFDAMRHKCGVADRFIESLSRCMKYDSKGGKTKSLFLKTLDERFVIKSLSTIETQAFLKFAPDYFDYMSKSLFHGLPSALAKMLGFFQVVIKNPVTGIELNYFLQVMENVFYEGQSDKMFDLKGSMRNRRIQATGEKDEVLLDENLLDYLSQSPVYVRSHSNGILASSISNDTLFCSKQNVMDYSLLVGLYDSRQELLVGIIDYIRTYTWDKKLESWIKDRGKHKPTVMSPKDYRNRFRASIPRYFPLAPSCWQVFGAQARDRFARVPFMAGVSIGEAGDEAEWKGDAGGIRERLESRDVRDLAELRELAGAERVLEGESHADGRANDI